jgi:bisanhydrobacterioruberin hydratase
MLPSFKNGFSPLGYILLLWIFYLVGALLYDFGVIKHLSPILSPFIIVGTTFFVTFKLFKAFFTNLHFIFLTIFILVSSFLIEVCGVKTGFPFGEYRYGNGLGIKLFDVPIVIGFSWAQISIFAYVFSGFLWHWRMNTVSPPQIKRMHYFFTFFFISGGIFGLFYDLILEKTAPLLDFWSFRHQERAALEQTAHYLIASPPFENYISWFILSGLYTFSIALFFENCSKQRAHEQYSFCIHILSKKDGLLFVNVYIVQLFYFCYLYWRS